MHLTMNCKHIIRTFNRIVGASRGYCSTSSSSDRQTSSSTGVTGFKLSYSEFGDPHAVIRKERVTIEHVPEDHVRA